MRSFASLFGSLLLPFVLAGAAAAQTAGLFATPSRAYKTGDQIIANAYRPYGLAAGDLNGDGVPDVALAHYGNFINPNVSVMPGLGDGGLGAPLVLPASGETMDVVAADLDGDGDLDLAFCESSEGVSGESVLVYLNHGNGTFAPERRFTVGLGPTSIAAADFDGDGDVDLATASWYWNEDDVSVLYNDGSARFTRVDFPVGVQPRYVAAGDLTGDGLPELLLTLRYGTSGLIVLENDGAGSFDAPVGAGPSGSGGAVGVAAADMDLDGDLDVLLGGSLSGSNAQLLWNDGAGGLGTMTTLSTQYSFGAVFDFAVADVTQDGWPDVLGVGVASQSWVLVASAGGGNFASGVVFRSGEDARAISTADMDVDGDLDVLVVDSGSLTVTVHENESGVFSMPPQVAVSPFCSGTDAGDLELDGDVDLVTVNTSFFVLRNAGTGEFTVEGTSPQLGGALGSPRLRDVDGDGFLDLLLLTATRFHVFLNRGDGTFGAPASYSLGANQTGELDTLDWDVDGDLDVVISEALGLSDGTMFYLLGNRGDGTFFPPTRLKSFVVVQANPVRAGDVNEDGFPDIIGGHNTTVASWLGNGNGTFQAPIITSLGQGGTVYMEVADFDGDGHLDVAGTTWGGTFRGENICVAFGYGDGDFTPPFLTYGMFSLSLGGLGGLDTADADGDGDLDLVGGAYAADDVCVFLNNGNRTFAQEQHYGVNGDVTDVTAADLDGDGRVDLAVNLGTGPPLNGAMALLFGSGDSLYYEDLGLALAGSRGLPVLTGAGVIAPGAPFALSLASARSTSAVFHVIGSTRVDYPLLGGTLVPLPEFVLLGATSESGTASLGLNWPTGLPAGSAFFAQSWVVDPAGVRGAAASNALRVQQP